MLNGWLLFLVPVILCLQFIRVCRLLNCLYNDRQVDHLLGGYSAGILLLQTSCKTLSLMNRSNFSSS